MRRYIYKSGFHIEKLMRIIKSNGIGYSLQILYANIVFEDLKFLYLKQGTSNV